MRTASGYQTPAVPYHTLICRSFSTPNTALVRKNAEYITNTENDARDFLTTKYSKYSKGVNSEFQGCLETTEDAE